MCIAILNTSGTLDKQTFQTCWKNNPDGGGLAWNEGGKLQIFKEMKQVDRLYSKYQRIRKHNTRGNILIHFRVATHGKINATNCHPFLVNKNLAFIHNGIISGAGLETHADFSDTYLFNQLILQKLPRDFTTNEAILNLLAQYIDYSKLIFLDSFDNWTIVNEDLGHWDGGNWYSNESYKACKMKHSAPRYYGYGASYCDICSNEAKTKFSPEFNLEICAECMRRYESAIY